MLYTKDGFPEINEIILCTVKKIYGNTVFVDIDEYEKEGVLTISEIAPGRIRNLRDYVVEEKKIICKVLRVDEKLNRVDVSLRRVPIIVANQKKEQIKKEEYADKMYQDIAKELSITKDELFEKTFEVIFDNYETVFEALYDIMTENSKIELFTNLTSREKEIFVKVVNDKIKPEEIIYKKTFKLISIQENGIEEIKNTIRKALEEINYDKIKINYLAAGEFSITIIHDSKKVATDLFKKFVEIIEITAKNNKCLFEYEQTKKQ